MSQVRQYTAQGRGPVEQQAPSPGTSHGMAPKTRGAGRPRPVMREPERQTAPWTMHELWAA
eukprot:10051871-Lingulodinium_polyedra.AAC.1